MPRSFKAITFDFWRTLYYAHRDSEERRTARVEAVVTYTGAAPEAAAEAFKAVSQEFLRVHIAEQRTLAVRDAIPMLERELSITIPDACAEPLVHELADAFRRHPPAMIDGALEAIEAAARRAPVGLISDTGLTPGGQIRALLDTSGFGPHIDAYSFSDEVGVAKPQPAIFHHAADRLGVSPEEMLHVGDLEPTDVAGAINVQAGAALFAGDNDRYVAGTRANRVYLSWRAFIEELPDLLG